MNDKGKVDARAIQKKVKDFMDGARDPDPAKAIAALKALNNGFADTYTQMERMSIALYRIQEAAKIPKGPWDQDGFTKLMEVIATVPEISIDPQVLKEPHGPKLARF